MDFDEMFSAAEGHCSWAFKAPKSLTLDGKPFVEIDDFEWSYTSRHVNVAVHLARAAALQYKNGTLDEDILKKVIEKSERRNAFIFLQGYTGKGNSILSKSSWKEGFPKKEGFEFGKEDTVFEPKPEFIAAQDWTALEQYVFRKVTTA